MIIATEIFKKWQNDKEDFAEAWQPSMAWGKQFIADRIVWEM